MPNCEVCCESFNKSTHKKVICNYCNYDVCTTCTKKYLLGLSQDPHCMNCKNAWNRENMEANFTKKFYTTEYKAHRENIIFERQLSLLPETQPYVEISRKKVELNNENDLLKKEMKDYIKKSRTHSIQNTYQFTPDELIAWHKMQCKFRKKIECLKISIETNNTIIRLVIGRDTVKAERRQFVRHCPSNDCKGFLSTQWKCGLCDAKVCSKCHEIKSETEIENDNHECKPENVASAELLAKECRACPKSGCGAMIFKVSGCDQMWCSQCHTAFSWKTGQIETGNIHNPHYYEFQRQNNGGIVPRAPGDNLCGGLPEYYTLSAHLCTILNLSVREVYVKANDTPELVTLKLLYNKISTIHRMHGHIEHVELPRYRPNNQIENHRDLRINYMLNIITKEHFKTELYKREKDTNKKNEITMVLQTYQNIIMESIIEIMNIRTIAELTELYERMDKLRIYINECLLKISNRYGNVTPQITSTWQLSSTGIIKNELKLKQQEAARKYTNTLGFGVAVPTEAQPPIETVAAVI